MKIGSIDVRVALNICIPPESCGKSQASFASAHARLRDGGHGIARLSLVRQVEWGVHLAAGCGWQLRSFSWANKLKNGNVGPPKFVDGCIEVTFWKRKV